MKMKYISILLILLLILMIMIPACKMTTSTITSTLTTTKTQAIPATLQSTTTAMPTKANWWDKFGKPKYGGALTQRISDLNPSFDSTSFLGYFDDIWDQFFTPDWKLDRNNWSFHFGNFIPEEYTVGGLAESWNWTDPTTLKVTIRKGIHYHNKPPVNGREFIADDIVFTFDRFMGTGHGYTKPNEGYTSFLVAIEKVNLIDRYTLEVKFKNPSPWINMRVLLDPMCQYWEAPEVVALGPHTEDLNTAIGTGPFMVHDLVRNSTMTLIANPDYWGYDERYPENKLPYIQSVKYIIIPDDASAIAALRTGKIDFMGNQSLTTKKVIEKSNPEIVTMGRPSGGTGIGMRLDLQPFSDIRVRKALQLAVDISSIAKNYYEGTVSEEPCGIIHPGEKGYCYPYNDWPQSLKDEYKYSPQKAKQLLAEAGYPGGFNTDIVLSSEGTDIAYFEIFKSMFAEIGVNMEIRPYDRATAESITHSGKTQGMVGGTYAATQPPNIALRTWTTGATGNIWFLSDPVVDDLFNQLNTKAASPEDAQRIIRTFDKHMIEQHYVVVGPAPVSYALWQPYLKGYSGETGLGRNGARMITTFYAARVWIDQTTK